LSDADFWSDRVRRYGHTGWSDAAVYAYDQPLRLAAFRKLLDARPGLQSTAALDFGCGSGDFCVVLAEHFTQVVGYDLSARVLAVAVQRNSGERIRYTIDRDEALGQRYALILCVTVLQHVVDDAELQALVRRLADALLPGGQVVVLETFAGAQPAASDYLKRRTLAALEEVFADAGLVLRSQRGFYHPSERPTTAFLAYRSRLTVRLLARLTHWRVPLVPGWLHALAARFAQADHEALDQPDSPTQWLVFEGRTG